jgi:group I intron endonuclease
MKGKIYKITNKLNGKIYVGQTIKSLEDRFQKHCCGTSAKDKYHFNMAIKKAIRKYGKDNFTIELIEKDAFIQFLSTNPTCKEVESKFKICRCSVFNYLKKHHIEYNFSKSVRTLPSNVEG